MTSWFLEVPPVVKEDLVDALGRNVSNLASDETVMACDRRENTLVDVQRPKRNLKRKSATLVPVSAHDQQSGATPMHGVFLEWR